MARHPTYVVKIEPALEIGGRNVGQFATEREAVPCIREADIRIRSADELAIGRERIPPGHVRAVMDATQRSLKENACRPVGALLQQLDEGYRHLAVVLHFRAVYRIARCAVAEN